MDTDEMGTLAVFEPQEDLEGRELQLGMIKVLQVRVDKLTTALKERDVELAARCASIDSLRNRLAAEAAASARQSQRLRSLNSSHEMQLRQEAAARQQLEARLQSAEARAEELKEQLREEQGARDERAHQAARGRLLVRGSVPSPKRSPDREELGREGTGRYTMWERERAVLMSELANQKSLHERVARQLVMAEQRLLIMQMQLGAEGPGGRDPVRPILQEFERITAEELALAQTRVEELSGQLHTAQHKCMTLEATNAEMAAELERLRRETAASSLPGRHATQLLSSVEDPACTSELALPRSQQDEELELAHSVRRVQLRRCLLQHLLSLEDGHLVGAGCLARVLNSDAHTYRLLQVVALEPPGPGQAWTEALVRLEDGGCILAGKVSRKQARDDEVHEAAQRISADPRRARDIAVKAAEVHAICQLVSRDEEASQSESTIVSCPQTPINSQPNCVSFPVLKSTADPAAFEADSLDGQHVHLATDVEAPGLVEELFWAHHARAMEVHELDQQLEAARAHVRAREEEDAVLAVKLLEVVSATARQAEHVQQHRRAWERWQEAAAGVQAATHHLEEHAEREHSLRTAAETSLAAVKDELQAGAAVRARLEASLQVAALQAEEARAALSAERSNRLALQDALAQARKDQETRAQEQAQWEESVSAMQQASAFAEARLAQHERRIDERAGLSAGLQMEKDALAAEKDKLLLKLEEERAGRVRLEEELEMHKHRARAALEVQVHVERDLHERLMQAESNAAEAEAACERASDSVHLLRKQLLHASGQGSDPELEAWGEAARERSQREQVEAELQRERGAHEATRQHQRRLEEQLLQATCPAAGQEHARSQISGSGQPCMADASHELSELEARHLEEEEELLGWLECACRAEHPQEPPRPELEGGRYPEAAPATLDLGPASTEPSPVDSATHTGNATRHQPSRLSRARRCLRYTGLTGDDINVVANMPSASNHARLGIHTEGFTARQVTNVAHQLLHGEDVLRRHVEDLEEEKEELRLSLETSEKRLCEMKFNLTEVVEQLIDAEAALQERHTSELHVDREYGDTDEDNPRLNPSLTSMDSMQRTPPKIGTPDNT